MLMHIQMSESDVFVCENLGRIQRIMQQIHKPKEDSGLYYLPEYILLIAHEK